MYKLDLDLIDGYLNLIGDNVLREPFKSNNRLISKYARGFRPSRIPYDKLRYAYSVSDSILEGFLVKSIDLTMRKVRFQFKQLGDIDLKNVERVDDGFIIKFALASKKIQVAEFNTNKCDVIFDYYNIKISQEQRETLDFIFRTNLADKIEKVADSVKTIQTIEDEKKRLLAENQLEMDALISERIELFKVIEKKEDAISELETEKENTIKAHEIELKKVKDTIDKQNEKIEQIKLSEEYMEGNDDENTTTSFCVYGIYVSNSGEEYNVAYRIADVHKGILVEKKEIEGKLWYITFKPSKQASLSIGDSGIWQFDACNGWAKEQISNIRILEIVKPIDQIRFEKGKCEQLGELLGAGVELSCHQIITRDFMLVIGETDEQYIVLLTNKNQWESKTTKFVLVDFDNLYEVAYIKKSFAFRQHEPINANDIEYKDRMFVVNDDRSVNVFDKVDLIFPKEILQKAISKMKSIYIITNQQRQKFKNLVDEVCDTNDTKQMQLLEKIKALDTDNVETRKELLLKSLKNIEIDLHAWDNAFQKLIQNHPQLYNAFSEKVEKEWRKNNEQAILEANKELESLNNELNKSKASLEEIEEKALLKKEEYEKTIHQIDAMSEDICNAVKEASGNAIKVVADSVILNALCNDQAGAAHIPGYCVEKTRTVSDIEIRNEIPEDVILDNFDIYDFVNYNPKDMDVTSFIVAALQSNKVPIIVSSESALITNCISIAIYGTSCNIIDINNSIKMPIDITSLEKQTDPNGLILIRDAIGGVKEQYIVNLLRGTNGNSLSNRLVLSCETAEELKYAPMWLHNYTVIIDMEDCCFAKNNNKQYGMCKEVDLGMEDIDTKKDVKQLVEALKTSFKNHIAPLNNRYSVFEAILAIENNTERALEMLFQYDLIPLYKCFGIDADSIKNRIASIRLSDFDGNRLAEKLEKML